MINSTIPAPLLKKTAKTIWPNVAGNVLLLTIGAGIAQALMFVSMLLTARQLGSMRFGEYAASFSASGLTAVLFNLGLDTWLLQRGSYDPKHIGVLTGSAFAIKAFAGIPWIVGMVLILPQMNSRTFNAQLVLVSALSVWMEGFLTTSLSVFRALLRNQLTVLLMIGARGGLLLMTAALVTADVESSIIYAVARLSVAVLIAFILPIILPARPVTNFTVLKIAGRESLPFALSDVFASLYLQADTTIIAAILGKEDVGLYTLASSFINALFVIPNAWFFVAVPVIVRVLKSDKRSFYETLGLTWASFMALGIILWLGVHYTSSILPRFVLGESFERSGPLLAILSPILLLKSCSFAAAAILVSVGWQSRRVFVQAISAITNVMLNLMVIRRSGIKGVAIVYVISEAVLLIGYISLVVGWMRRNSGLFSLRDRCQNL